MRLAQANKVPRQCHKVITRKRKRGGVNAKHSKRGQATCSLRQECFRYRRRRRIRWLEVGGGGVCSQGRDVFQDRQVAGPCTMADLFRCGRGLFLFCFLLYFCAHKHPVWRIVFSSFLSPARPGCFIHLVMYLLQ